MNNLPMCGSCKRIEKMNSYYFKSDDIRNDETAFAKYYELDNYKVIDNECSGNKCIVFFSAIAFYFASSDAEAKQLLIDDDIYEWQNIAKSKMIKNYYSRVIFVRDVLKNWYIRGINNRVNTQDKVCELLQNITEGYEVYTCGSSAGGYGAVLYGCLLNAKAIYSFSGQFDISVNNKYWNNVFLNDNGKNNDYKYFNLIDLVRDFKNMIFYFYPQSVKDKYDYELISGEKAVVVGLRIVSLKSLSHADTLIGANFPYVLTMDIKKLGDLAMKNERKCMHKVLFFWKTAGVRSLVPCFKYILGRLWIRIRKINIKK